MITSVHILKPGGFVITYDKEKRIIRALSGQYQRVKYKLLPAINSCNPAVLDETGRVNKDMIRFCNLREHGKNKAASTYAGYPSSW